MAHLSKLQAVETATRSHTKSFLLSSERQNNSTQAKCITSGIKNKDSSQRFCFDDDCPLVTIEFTPDIHLEETEYNYPHPQFVFSDR